MIANDLAPLFSLKYALNSSCPTITHLLRQSMNNFLLFKIKPPVFPIVAVLSHTPALRACFLEYVHEIFLILKFHKPRKGLTGFLSIEVAALRSQNIAPLSVTEKDENSDKGCVGKVKASRVLGIILPELY